MAANEPKNAEHIDSLDNESVTNSFASLAGLFEKRESDTELIEVEGGELANEFELQLTRLAGTLDASLFG